MTHCKKKSNLHPQLIHMILEEGTWSLKVYNKNIYKLRKKTLET
jgi:hypothetical protein